MMRKVLISLLCAVALASCSKDFPPDTAKMEISVFIPGTPESKADNGAVLSAYANENHISSLKIWVFYDTAFAGHAAGERMAYLEPDASGLKYGYENRFYVEISVELAKAIAEAQTKPNVVVFALANAEAAGLSVNADSSINDLKNLNITGENFGFAYDSSAACYVPAAQTVPAGGLPFSGVKRRALSGNYPVLRIDKVELKRCVSKILFVFSQLEDQSGEGYTEFKLLELSLDSGNNATDTETDSGIIFVTERVFTGDVQGSQAKNYVQHTLNFVPDPLLFPTVNHCKNPSSYAFESGSAQDYQDLIYSGIEKNELTPWGLCYLRETASHRKITGHIKWQAGTNTPVTRTFTIPTGDFVRNRSVIIYAYFVRDEIHFSAGWTDWAPGHDYNLTD